MTTPNALGWVMLAVLAIASTRHAIALAHRVPRRPWGWISTAAALLSMWPRQAIPIGILATWIVCWSAAFIVERDYTANTSPNLLRKDQ